MKKRYIAIIIFILSLTLSILFFVFWDFFKEAKSLGLLGLFIINFISSASLFVSAPALLTVVAGGSIYPPILVALVSSFGSAGGDLVGFAMGFSGRHLTSNKFRNKIWFKVINNYFAKYGGWMLFIFSFVPNPFFDSIGIIAGIFAYPLTKYFPIVFLGRFLRYLLLAQFGSLF